MGHGVQESRDCTAAATMPEMLISDALICDLDLKRVTNMLSATRVNTTRHWYAVAYGK